MADTTDRALPGEPTQIQLDPIELADRFDLTKTSVLLNGAQAVARLLIAQKERDRRAGLQYRRLHLRLSRLAGRRARSAIRPAEEAVQVATTSISSPASTRSSPRPRSGARSRRRCAARASSTACSGSGTARAPASTARGDVFRHANLAGTSPHGGVLALMGDDHTAESSTTAHQSEFALRRRDDADAFARRRAGNPRLWRARLGAEPLRRRLGRHQMHQGHDRIDRRGRRLARSRAGPSFPPITRCRRAASTSARPTAFSSRRRGCRNTSATRSSPGSPPTRSTARSLGRRRTPKIGIITAGKSYLDVRQALDDLGIDEARCNALGLRIFKLGCVWPVVPDEMREFARGLDLIIVVEEKRSLIETQVREELYGSPQAADLHRQARRGGRMAVPGQGRARSQQYRDRDRRAAAEISSRRRGCAAAVDGSEARADARSPRSSRRRCARPISARAARTTARP